MKATGRKQLVIAGLWTEVCVAMPAIQAGLAAGVNIMTWLAVAAEWQRDWARIEQAMALTEVITKHAGGSGIAYLWEQQLLNTPVPAQAG